jgi:hypothetical protein
VNQDPDWILSDSKLHTWRFLAVETLVLADKLCETDVGG